MNRLLRQIFRDIRACHWRQAISAQTVGQATCNQQTQAAAGGLAAFGGKKLMSNRCDDSRRGESN